MSADKFKVSNARLLGPSVFVVLGLVFIGLYFPAFSGLLGLWNNSDQYGHGWLVALLTLWLVVKELPNGSKLVTRHGLLVSLFIVALTLLWHLSMAIGVQLGAFVLIPPIILALIILVFGVEVGAAAAWPVMFLYFAIPIWDFLSPVLQQWTVVSTNILLILFSIPSKVSGDLVFLPNGTFEIAGGCSGLHYFMVAGTISAVHGYLSFSSRLLRALLFMIALFLAILGNWIRVFIIIVSGYLTDMQHYLVAVDHYWFGWVIFAILLIPLFYVALKLQTRDINLKGEESAKVSVESAGRHMSQRGVMRSFALGLVSLAFVPLVFSIWEKKMAPDYAIVNALELPKTLEKSNFSILPSTEWEPHFFGYTRKLAGAYIIGEESYNVFWSVYTRQSQGAELITFENRIADPKRWQIESNAQSVIGAHGDELPIREVVMRSVTNSRLLVFYVYLVAGSVETQEHRARFAQLGGLVRGRSDSALLAMSVSCRESICKVQRERLGKLFSQLSHILICQMQALEPEFDRELEKETPASLAQACINKAG